MKIRDRIKSLRRVKASELLPHPKNWRTHPQAQQDALRGVLAEIGWAGAALVRETPDGLQLIDGHLRGDLAGDAKVPCLVLDVTEAEADKILATFDPVGKMAEADDQKLGELLAEIETESEGVQALLEELAEAEGLDLFEPDEPEEPPEPQIDRAAELQKEWGTELGQLWVIGEHRLLCGDSTKAEDVGRVMREERAGLMNTDPPYGLAYDNKGIHPNAGPISEAIENDDLCDEHLQAFLEAAFLAAVKSALVEHAAWYMWHAHLTQGYFAAAAAAAAANVVLHRQIIWVKPVLVFGRGQFHQKHEPCFMGWVKGNQPPDYGEGHGERTQTTVWEIDSVSHADRKEYNHSTPKPVGLFTIPIVKHLKPGEICYEPFAGSGPQFVAAQQLNRRCFGIEISPAYCGVILQRMADMGLEPHKQDA